MTGQEMYGCWLSHGSGRAGPTFTELPVEEQVRFTGLGNQMGAIVDERDALRRTLEAIDAVLHPRRSPVQSKQLIDEAGAMEDPPVLHYRGIT